MERAKNTKKVLFTASVVKLHMNLFHVPFLKLFKDAGWETAVAAHNDYAPGEDWEIKYCDSFTEIPFEKKPFKARNLQAYKELKKLIDEGDFDVIHCHTPMAAFLTRFAARKARKQGCKVFYTAHGFHFFKGAPLINWLLYCPAEWISSFFTDCLITINKEDYRFAKKHLHAERIEYVPGVGIDTEKFRYSESARAAARKRLGLDSNPALPEKMLLSVGELSPRKNHEAVIRALSRLERRDWKYFIVGQGDLKDYLTELIKSCGLEDRVELLGFRKDIPVLMSAADLFVFPSKQEGLPVAVMEALSSGIDVLCTDIRGNSDLVPEEKLFKLGDEEGLVSKLSSALDDIGSSGRDRNQPIGNAFSLGSVLEEMKRIYFG